MSGPSLKPGWKMVKLGDIAEKLAASLAPTDAQMEIFVGLYLQQ